VRDQGVHCCYGVLMMMIMIMMVMTMMMTMTMMMMMVVMVVAAPLAPKQGELRGEYEKLVEFR
jgi:hypothetical protein